MTDCRTLQFSGGWWEGILAGRCTFPIEPRNTWTNLAFVVAGIALGLTVQAAPAWAAGLGFVFVGVGSFCYHGFKEDWAGQLDDASMYGVFSGLYAFVIYAPWWLVLGCIGFGAWMLGYRTKVKIENWMGCYIAVLLLAGLLHRRWWWTLAGFLLCALGYAFWWADKKRWLRSMWWHALWHLCEAPGMYCLAVAARP